MKIIDKLQEYYRLITNKWDPGVAVEYVYTDRAGVKYYQLKNLAEMSYSRSITAEVATRQAEFNLTKEQLKMLISQMREDANDGNIVSLFTLISEIEQRLMYAGEEETLLQLASVYFFAEGEDVNTWNSVEQMSKIARWRTDDAAKAFFLRMAFLRTKSYMSISERDLLASSMTAHTDSSSLLSNILGTQSSLISMRQTTTT